MTDAIDIVSAVQWEPNETIDTGGIFIYNTELFVVSDRGGDANHCCIGCHFHGGSNRAGCVHMPELPDCYQKIFIKVR